MLCIPKVGLESTLESRCARDNPLDCLVEGLSRMSLGVPDSCKSCSNLSYPLEVF